MIKQLMVGGGAKMIKESLNLHGWEGYVVDLGIQIFFFCIRVWSVQYYYNKIVPILISHNKGNTEEFNNLTYMDSFSLVLFVDFLFANK